MPKFHLIILASLSPVGLATSASAADIGNGLSVTGGATLISDYRFRGISQTDKRFAVQGTFSIAHASGLCATVWGSSIDDYVYNGADQEIDLSAGYRKTFGKTTVDGGVLYYYYPGSGGINSDFFEPYLSVAQAFGPVTAKVTANYAPKQSALSIGSGREDNLYLAGDLSAAIPKTPLSLTAHLGHSYGPSYLTIGKGYTNWGFGGSVTVKNFTAGLSYVDTNGVFITPSGRDAAKADLVASLGAAF